MSTDHSSAELVSLGPRFKEYNNNTIDRAAYDVDATLVDDATNQHPTSAFLSAADIAIRAGMSVGTQSARGANKMVEPILNPLARTSMNAVGSIAPVRYHGLSNGGQIYDLETGKMHTEWNVPLGVTAEVAHYLQEQHVEHWIQDDGIDYVYEGGSVGVGNSRDNGLGAYGRPRNIWLPPSGSNLEIVEAYRPQKPLVIVADNLTRPQFDELMAFGENFRDENVVPLKYGEKNGLYKVFILRKEANKRTALEIISELSGVAVGNTVVTGDSNNDAVMLQAAVEAGGVGMAVGNAAHETMASATFIVPDQKDNGAAAGLSYTTKYLR
jgi:hydroxymethylpyrimidine pyrophosphatase-like HAD family hydrolase